MDPVLFKVSDESLNSHGFRILSSGGDFTRFKQNPIALYNHMRPWKGTEDEILPIGTWSDLKVHDNGDITALFNPDTEEEFSAKVAKKIEKKIIVAASVGILAMEWSEDPKHLLPGQKYATVTKWELREISPVDIPSNANAVCLYDPQGKAINLSDQGAIPIPKLKEDLSIKPEVINQNITSPKEPKMELKSLCLTLGLAEDSQPAAIELSVVKLKDKLKAADSEIVSLKADLAKVKTDEAKSLVALALSEKRIVPAQEQSFIDLFAKDFDATKALLATMPPQVTLSQFTGAGTPGAAPAGIVLHEGKTFKQLMRENPKELEKLKVNNIETFKQMYKQDFGKEWPAENPAV